MSFDVELMLSGLGVLWSRSREPRDPSPEGVDFLMVACAHGHAHQPRLSFCFEDLAGPEDVELPMHVGADGVTLASVDLTGRAIAVEAAGGPDAFSLVWCREPGATRPGPADPDEALDWIPEAAVQLGLDHVVGPGDEAAATVYSARIPLPSGRIGSRRLFPRRGADEASDWQDWRFGDTPPRVLAEYVSVACPKIDRLVVRLDDEAFVFDNRALRRAGRPGPLRLALTNLPPDGKTGRYLSPEHFPMYRMISRPPRDPWSVRRAEGGTEPATTGGACPPVRSGSYSG